MRARIATLTSSSSPPVSRGRTRSIAPTFCTSNGTWGDPLISCATLRTNFVSSRVDLASFERCCEKVSLFRRSANSGGKVRHRPLVNEDGAHIPEPAGGHSGVLGHICVRGDSEY